MRVKSKYRSMETRLKFNRIKQFHKLTSFFMLLCMLLISIEGVSQGDERTVSGQVVSNEGMPLPGVSIVKKGTTTGTVTDSDGRFSISASANDILVFSFIGFQQQEMPVGDKSVIDLQMEEDVKQLKELVVVGYGTVEKSDLTGSVVSIKPDEMTAGANLTLEQMMQGRAAGVNIKSKSGEPGGAISIKIRGASSITAGNEPLYVIDGIPFDNTAPIRGTGAGFVGNPNPRNPLNALNPNDIASIEILKDASATAIYGSRGSNGVVLITTKSGAGGTGELKVNYNYSYSLQEIAKKYNMLDAHQYQQVLNDILQDGGFFGEERVGDFQGDGINWAELLYRDGTINEHNLSFNGGSDETNYFVSLNYFDQEGILINSGIERYNVRFNINSGKSDRYKVGMNLNTSFIKDDFISNGVGINDNSGALYAALNYDPTLSRVIDPFTGRYTLSEHIIMDNPLALAHGEQANAKTFRTYGSVFAEYFIVPGFSAKVKLGGNATNARREVWIDPMTIEGQPTGGIATVINSTRTNYLGEFTLNFNRKIGIHRVNAVVGTTYEEFNQFNSSANGSGFLYPDLKTNAIGSGADSLEFVGSSSNQYKLHSYLGRVNYSLADKYLVTLTGRVDGSSRFGDNHKYGFFPSAAVAWKVHEEDFFEDNEIFSQLKFRVSYGVIGNQAIGNYRYVTSFSGARDAYLGGILNPALQPSRAANPDLRWESAQQFDVGFDFGLLNDRMEGTIEYYVRDTEDLLLNVPQPISSGFTVRTENIGSMRNSGLELNLNAHVLQFGDFKWEINANFSTLKNVVTDLGDAGSFTTGSLGFVRDAVIVAEDTAVFSFYGHQIEGVWQEGDDFSSTKMNVSPGDWKYRDVNGDSIINAADRQILGKPFPDYQWGLNSTFSYKNLSLSVFFEGSHGNSILNYNLIDSYYPISFRRNKIAEPYLNRWTPENPTNEYSSFVNPMGQGALLVNSKTVEDASFVRLQSVRLGYNVPVDNLGVKFIDRLNIYVVGQNLFTITGYSGVDPGTNSFGNDLIPIDFNSYPFAKTYTIGLNLGF